MANELERKIEITRNKVIQMITQLDSDNDPNFKIGYVEAELKFLKDYLEEEKDVIGRTLVTWIEEDIQTAFDERFGRQPDINELEDIRYNYLDLEDVGAETAIEIGWDRIHSVLDDYAKDNDME